MKVPVTIYLHSDKECSYDAAEEAGLTGEALDYASFLGYEEKMTYMVDTETGEGVLVSVNDIKLPVKVKKEKK